MASEYACLTMQIVEQIDVISRGRFPRSREWRKACDDVEAAVALTDWPHGSGKFKIYPGLHANGVTPIKVPCLAELIKRGWKAEQLPIIEPGPLTTGDLDALLSTPRGSIGFEWETGNISSSHRAVNKLVLTLYVGGIKGGFLVVPSRALYVFLTDRVGNIAELAHYVPLWQAVEVADGALRFVVVEHDATSKRVPPIPKTTAGRAQL
jgi:hypothetical protein